MPGMEKCELTMIGPAIGFRETRRLVGRYTLTAEDVLTRRTFEDGVGRGGKNEYKTHPITPYYTLTIYILKTPHGL